MAATRTGAGHQDHAGLGSSTRPGSGRESTRPCPVPPHYFLECQLCKVRVGVAEKGVGWCRVCGW
jgi:hypothetical protein